MLRISGEVRVHSDEQVETIISAALEQAGREGVPAPLREAVFVQACGLYAQKQLTVEQIAVAPNGLAVPRG